MNWVNDAQVRLSGWWRTVKRVRGRWVSTNVQVYGARGTGKTTLLNQLEKRGVAVSGGETHGREDERPLTEAASRVGFDTIGIGGRAELWSEWTELLAERLPSGIIFLIDHETDLQSHSNALKFLVGFLASKKGNKARKRCKVFLLLANKQDLWHSEQSDKDDHSFAKKWEGTFTPEVSKLRELGLEVLVGCGSAKFYDYASDQFDDLIDQFVDFVL